MVCFRYIIVNTLLECDNKDNNNNNNNNNNKVQYSMYLCNDVRTWWSVTDTAEK